MRRPVGLVRERLVPAVLTAAGVTLLAAGLLHYGTTADARVADGSSSPAAPVASLPDFVVPSLPPLDGSPVPTVAPSTDPNRVATRIVIEALGIDLPIVVQPNSGYPWCNVAMYIDNPLLGQPGGGRSVYLYAHARDGMFGPLYERITLGRSGGAKSLIGMPVLVYTSDDHVYEYAITKIHPRVPADTHFLDRPFAVTTETLWLQTSTGHGGDLPKLQVEALPFFDDVASHADAHPRARPVVCG